MFFFFKFYLKINVRVLLPLNVESFFFSIMQEQRLVLFENFQWLGLMLSVVVPFTEIGVYISPIIASLLWSVASKNFIRCSVVLSIC